jgi:signal transduction histidine kinase
VVPLVASSVWLALTSDHLYWPAATAAHRSYLVAAPMLIGLLWWRRRPASRFGPLLVLFGLAAWPLSWQASDWPPAFSLGVLADAPFIVLNFYVLLAFPIGRIETRTDRLLMGSFVAVYAVFFVPSALLSDQIAGGGPLARCAAPCPENSLQVASAPDAARVASTIDLYASIAITVGVIATYVARLLTASRPRRRALAAVAATSLLLLPLFLAFHVSTKVLHVDSDTADVLAWALIGARIIYPLGFLLALMQSERFAAVALRQLLAELASRPPAERWRAAVARALDDPSVSIAYAADAAPVQPEPARGRVKRPVAREGEPPLAVIEADEVLAQEPELLDAAAEATLVALDTGQLEAELRASRARIVEAGDAERRRIARDLHDSAQQRLIALRVQLRLAAEEDGREDLTPELDAALEELRAVARGLYPPLLAQHGVAAALRSVARAAALPVTIEDRGLGRHSELLESTVYFCCLEALQNACKHAGAKAAATVRLSSDAHGIRFAVEDDGAGFDPKRTERGTGLASLNDRLAAVGGTLQLDSARGDGTRVEGNIPA